MTLLLSYLNKRPKWLLVLLTGFGAQAQVIKLPFAKDSLGQVLVRARQQQKPVFVVLTAPVQIPKDLTKQQVAQRYGSALDDDEVATRLKRDFLLVRASQESPDAQRLSRRYGINTYPTYLYLAPDGTVLHRSFGNTYDPQHFLQDIATVQQQLASPDNLSHLEHRYAQGERGAAFLRGYIQARRRVGAATSPQLLEEYVGEVPVKEFERLAEVIFVFEAGPVLDSRAYKAASLDQRLVDSLYQTLPLAQRQNINSAIISHTLQEAIARHDQQLAFRGATFARATWQSNHEEGQRVYEQKLLQYYRGVRDTTRYLPLLARYYERYMGGNPDTLRQRQERRLLSRSPFRNDTPYADLSRPDSLQGVGVVRVLTSVTRPANVDFFAAELNGGAWAMYTSGTRQAPYLAQALRWSQRTVALDPRPAYYDTLAHLLYAMHLSVEAAAMQQKAVALARKSGEPVERYQQALARIKAGTLTPEE